MAGITKQTAADLYKWDYKLQDKEGRIWDINSIIGNTHFYIWHKDESQTCFLDQIGTKFKIMCRKLDLNKKIFPSLIPIVELAKIAYPEHTWFLKNNNATAKPDYSIVNYNFQYNAITNCFSLHGKVKLTVRNQEALFAWLDKHHFLRGVEEECLIYINE